MVCKTKFASFVCYGRLQMSRKETLSLRLAQFSAFEKFVFNKKLCSVVQKNHWSERLPVCKLKKLFDIYERKMRKRNQSLVNPKCRSPSSDFFLLRPIGRCFIPSLSLSCSIFAAPETRAFSGPTFASFGFYQEKRLLLSVAF